VQPVHDQHDGTGELVVEPAVKGVVVPLVGGLPLRLGERLLRLQRIIDQDDVGAASGEHPAGGGGEPVALPGGDELLHCLAVWGEAGREDLPIPWARHDAAAIAGELVGEIPRQPAGRYGGERGQVARVKCARSPLLPPRIMSRRPSIAHLSLLHQPRGDLVAPMPLQCPPVHSSDP